MIKGIKITKGFAKGLSGLKEEISLSTGINVIVGENGSGKTTLLRILAAYCGCPDKGGWSTWPTPHDLCLFGETPNYPKSFERHRLAQRCVAKQAYLPYDG